MDSSIYDRTILKLLSGWLSPNRANRNNALAAAGIPLPQPSPEQSPQSVTTYAHPDFPFEPPGSMLDRYMPPIPTASRQGGYGGGWQPQPPPPPQMNAMNPATWASLGDQSREKAFDPTRDMNDPRNIHAVDENGRLIFGPYRMPRG